jgi:acetyltransferase-like isoleucine patch superfamily enzyme
VSHLLATSSPKLPADLIVGALEVISHAPQVHLINVVGTKVMAPGWYLLSRLWDTHQVPLAGPFNRRDDAVYAYTIARTRAVNTVDRFAFIAQNALLLDPVVFVKPSMIQIGDRARIDSFVKIEGGEGVVVGANVHIASFAHVGIGGGLTILEEGSAVASHACIVSGSNQPDAPSMSPLTAPDQNRIVRKTTILRRNAAVLTGAIVSPGVTIGEGARVLPGAVVTRDVPAFETWAGIPARKVQ